MLYLLDVSGFIYRAYHALPPLESPQKEPIGALFGFCSMIIKLLSFIEKDSKLLAVFDSQKKNFRHEFFPNYKATRKETPEDLIVQFQFVRDACDAFGIPRTEMEGFEADDIIASYTYAFSKVTIVSSDKDLLQLMNHHVRFLDPVTYVEKTEEDVIKKFGVSCDKLVDLLSLMGDASDNIPGVVGIGPKTAAELLNTFGSLEKIYNNLDKIKQKKRKETLEVHRENAFLSKKLIQLLPLTSCADVPDITCIHNQREDFLKKWGFESLIKRIAFSKTQEAIDPFHQAWPPLEKDPKGILYIGNMIKTSLPYSYDDVGMMAALLGKEVKDPLRDHKQFKKMLVQERLVTLYERIERPLGRVLYHMESSGIRIDQEKLNRVELFYKEQQKIYEEKIFSKTQQKFNLASPKQLGEILFDVMKLPNPKKTKTQNYSTDSSVLEDLKEQGFDIADDILKWRMYTKLLTSYIEGFRPHIIKDRIHTTYSSLATGRLGSHNPNLQTIPIRTPEGRMIRECFIPEEGSHLISFDYSQIELRLLAFMGNIPELQNIFLNNGDVHEETALFLFGETNDSLRRIAKTINFGILYGISAYGLNQHLHLGVKECQNLIDTYFKRYSSILEYQNYCKSFALKHGYVETLFKRRIYVKDIESHNHIKQQFSERQAVNGPLQGSNADILKKAMIRIFKMIKDTPIKMVLSIHDELVFEIPDHLLGEWISKIQNTMETIVPFPLKVQWEKWN